MSRYHDALHINNEIMSVCPTSRGGTSHNKNLDLMLAEARKRGISYGKLQVLETCGRFNPESIEGYKKPSKRIYKRKYKRVNSTDQGYIMDEEM